MRKKYRIALLSLVLLLAAAASALLLPAYVYNHYELGFRQEYQMADALLVHANQEVAVRQAGVTDEVTFEEFVAVGNTIEKDVYEALQHFDRAKTVASNQARIPFLPAHYRDYQQLKTDSIDQLIAANTDFYAKKQHDHLFTNLFYTSKGNTDLLTDIDSGELWIKRVASVSATLPAFEADLQKLYSDEIISFIEYEYFKNQHAYWSELIAQTIAGAETGDWSVLDPAAIENNGPTTEAFVASVREMNTVRSSQGDKISAAIDSAYETVMKASLYYDDQGLAQDRLRSLMRQRSRILPSQGDGSAPVIMPVEIDEWRVS